MNVFQSQTSNVYDQIVLVGDSITEFAEDQARGFALAPAVRSAYIRRLDVVNRGFSGYSTSHVLKIMSQFIRPKAEGRIRLMTVWLGANDSVRPDPNGHQCVPLPDYKANLKKIVQHSVLKEHSPCFILITPPPVDEHQRHVWEGDNLWRTAERTKSYADACKAVGTELNIPVLDVWTLFEKAAGWKGGEKYPGSLLMPASDKLKSLLVDGLHLTPAGYRLVYDGLTSLINSKFPDLCPDKLPMIFPAWENLTAQGNRKAPSRFCSFM